MPRPESLRIGYVGGRRVPGQEARVHVQVLPTLRACLAVHKPPITAVQRFDYLGRRKKLKQCPPLFNT